MFLDFLLLALGLALLVGGAEALVRGASGLAARLGVAPLIVGLTVVAFGTSTPELVVSLQAAWQGQAEISFGNVVGSNVANVGLLLALTALVRPMTVHRSVVTREIPMMLLASLAALVLAADAWLSPAEAGLLARGDGLVLLLFFGVFLYYTTFDALGQAKLAREETQETPGAMAGWLMALLIVGGLLGLTLGGQLTVSGASGVARAAGISELVIGLTLVAVGTSLPELATCLAAARRGDTDLAVGNVAGSNIFNLLFVLGLSSAALPAEVPDAGTADLLVMLGFSLTLLPLAWTQKRISRTEGGALLVLYAGYVGWLAVR
ncbi:MAG: calcium/sodium antiporter [Phycisphaeraceae bacterium]